MQKKKGISLIVLVITIIVMIILAAAIILSLNNAGIIGNANKAVDKSNIVNIKAAADLAYADYLVEKPTGVTDLGEYLTNELVNDGTIEGRGKDYYIEMYDNETVVVKVGSAADMYYSGIIKKGDYINYDPTKGVEDTSNITYAGKWQVMGIDKNNQLLLLSEDYIMRSYSLQGNKGYLNGVEILNSICAEYGKGNGAVSARCINVEDINRVTEYNPEKEKYGEGKLVEYGNEVTYYWDGTEKPYYEASNSLKEHLLDSHSTNGFWWNGNTSSYKSNISNKQLITTIKNDFYYYPGMIKGLDLNSPIYKMLFGTVEIEDLDFEIYGEKCYWLASKCIRTSVRTVDFGLRSVQAGYVFANFPTYSKSESRAVDNLRAVVVLGSDIILKGNSESGFTISDYI